MNTIDKDLLTNAMREIRSLRRTNEILQAKVSVVDVFAACSGLRGSGGCMSVDIAWEIESRLHEVAKEEEQMGKQEKIPAPVIGESAERDKTGYL